MLIVSVEQLLIGCTVGQITKAPTHLVGKELVVREFLESIKANLWREGLQRLDDAPKVSASSVGALDTTEFAHQGVCDDWAATGAKGIDDVIELLYVALVPEKEAK